MPISANGIDTCTGRDDRAHYRALNTILDVYGCIRQIFLNFSRFFGTAAKFIRNSLREQAEDYKQKPKLVNSPFPFKKYFQHHEDPLQNIYSTATLRAQIVTRWKTYP